MNAALLAWRASGTVESLLVILVAVGLVVGWLCQRWPRADHGTAGLSALGLLALGSRAAHDRLALLPYQLDTLPVREWVGRIAEAEAQSFSVLAGAFGLAALVGAAWAWRRSAPDGSEPVRPVCAGFLVLLAAMGVGGPMGWWGAGMAAALVLGASLRPDARWALVAGSLAVGVALAAHSHLASLLVLDPADPAPLAGALRARDASWVLCGIAWVVCATTLGSASRIVVATLGMALLMPSVAQWPTQRSRHPKTLAPDTLPHPLLEATRLAGGCVVEPHTTRAVGIVAPPHGLDGCAPSSLRTVAAPPSTSLGEIVTLGRGPEASSIGLLTHIAPLPSRLAPWGTTRWEVPVFDAPQADADGRLRFQRPPLRNAWLVDLGPPRTFRSAQGEADLHDVLNTEGRVDLLVRPVGNLSQLHALCTEVWSMRPQDVGCALALGDMSPWESWLQQTPEDVGW